MVLSIIFLEDKQYFIAFINILWVSTVFSTPYLFLDTAAQLQWPVTQISTSQQFFLLIRLFNKTWTAFKKLKLCQRLHITIEKVKTVYRLNKVVFNRGDSSLECFNRVTHNYQLAAGSSQISYEGRTILVFVESYKQR